MRKRVSWVLLTLLTVMAMILTSCSATEEEKEGPTIITGTVTLPPAMEKEKAEEIYTEQPQYGGIGYGILAADIAGFDEAFIQHYAATSLHLTNEEMLQGDWTKGPAGTGESDWVIGAINAISVKTGALADSWEIPERGKMIFHIREGVRWHNKAPTNGREVTVEDVVYSMKRMCTNPGAYIKISYPLLAKDVKITGDEAARTVTVDATACPSTEWVNVVNLFPDYLSIMPKDALEYFKDNMNDWKNSIGTGPFMLTNYISNGSATFVRNPDYWMTNPIGPGKGDQLPYLEGIKLLVITDTATRQTAFRTKKVDGTSGEYDDMKEFLDNPDIKRMSYTAEACLAIYMRTDKADSPFSKLEVRQALMMATDFNKIKDEFYDGKATILAWPIAYVKEYKDAYVPMENLPANVQALYSHNLTKARELLTTAGYATGFETSICFYNTPVYADYLSMIASMWSDIGVKVTLDGRDYNTWVSRIRARNYSDLMYYSSSPVWQRFQNITGTSTWNQSYVNDARINEALAVALELINVDDAQLAKNYAALVPYILEQSWVIPTPLAYTYVVWWPWIKNWNGELSVGYYNGPNYWKYRWIDQDLKQKMMLED
jgi:peptide/nickel transport system substrate-binding protein